MKATPCVFKKGEAHSSSNKSNARIRDTYARGWLAAAELLPPGLQQQFDVFGSSSLSCRELDEKIWEQGKQLSVLRGVMGQTVSFSSPVNR